MVDESFEGDEIMTQDARSGKTSFRARARLIRLLGEELISSEVMALVELVKNSYDADASSVVVSLSNLADARGAVIEVVDDGHGMSLDDVLHLWMEPAASSKGKRQRKARTLRGRLPLGEKGVGRFAADKLGDELVLTTRTPAANDEVLLHVSWQQFEREAYLEDVSSSWEIRMPRTFPGAGHGTALQITRLRVTWDRALITRVRDGLRRLVSPHTGATDFRIVLQCPDYPQLCGEIQNELLENAPHVLRGTVDTNGMFQGLMADGSDIELDLRRADPDQFSTGATLRQPACGPFEISLHVWDLDALGTSEGRIDHATRAALRTSNGVSIYRDGFRVMPYGERGNDWLELNQRRVNNPTMRVSNNQIVGIVEITQINNPDLRDRTSREGLIDTTAYFDLKSMILSVLSILEEERFGKRHRRAIERRPVEDQDELLALLEDVRQTRAGAGSKSVLQQIERIYRKAREDQQARYEHAIRLAGIGLAAERMTPEFARTLHGAILTLRTMVNEVEVTEPESGLGKHLQQIQSQYELLDRQLDLMSPMYTVTRGTTEELGVSGVVREIATVFGHVLRTAAITVHVSEDAPLIVRMNRGHLMQVFLTLFDNAIRVLEHVSGQERQIYVRVTAGGDYPNVVVADSGPGVRAESREAVFAPFYASRPGGRGLGLSVARDILGDYGSTIELSATNELLTGANFRIKFDRRRIVSSTRFPEASGKGEGYA